VFYSALSIFCIYSYKASYFRQLYVVTWRCLLSNMREPEIFRSRFIQVMVRHWRYAFL